MRSESRVPVFAATKSSSIDTGAFCKLRESETGERAKLSKLFHGTPLSKIYCL